MFPYSLLTSSQISDTIHTFFQLQQSSWKLYFEEAKNAYCI